MTTATRPKVIEFRSVGIPAELRKIPQWVVWKLVYKAGQTKPWTKVPFDSKTGATASTTNPATWSSLNLALMHTQQYDGVGFVFTAEDDYIGIDLDGCRNPDTGAIEKWAQEIIDRFPTYCEISASQTGVHLICRGKLPEGRRRKGGIEMYDTGRYFVMTGHLHRQQNTIANCQKEIEKFHADLFPQAKTDEQKPANSAPVSVDDQAIVSKVTGGKNGDKYNNLWAGNTEGYTSHSEADQALCNRIAFFCGPNESRVDAVFRQSGLMRPKWDREDYRAATAARPFH